MGSTLVLICLMLSLSIAVIFPEMKYSQTSNTSISSEFEYMVSKQRKGFLILGLLALLTFFTSIQTLSVGIRRQRQMCIRDRCSFWYLCLCIIPSKSFLDTDAKY